MKTSQSKTSLLQHVQVAGVTAMLSLLGSPASAATTTFPQYPLLTGGNSIPPNIMLILDDSGSMAYPKMPEDTSTLSDSVSDRSYVNNTLYYNPAKTYLPWRTASKTLTDRLVAADFTSASTNATSPTADKQDLRSWTRNLGSGQNPNYVLESYFYVPKAGVSNPGSVAANYDKYRVGASTATGTGAAGSYNGGAIQKLVDSSIKTGTLSASKDKYSACTQVSTGSPLSVTIKIDGDQKADLYVYSSSTCSAGTNNQNVLASSTKNETPKSVTIQSPAAAIYFAILGDGKAVSGISYDVTAASWQNALPTGSARTTQQDELQNFANWYQYHRTRNKMAKAGASEAFGRLNKNYRVGFDTIWNRNTSGTSIGVTGSVPSLPIAYATNNGLFEDNGTSVTNRSTFYSRLQSATANSGTPLHGALQRAGRYFATDDPWKDSDGTKLTCRQNYAILTTDGYWNQKDGFVGGDIATYSDGTNAGDGSGNVDSGAGYPYQDNIAYTLADVAYYYWKNDLKYGVSWPDNVKTSGSDSAKWQHMVTFGVSIGLQGNLDPSLAAPNPFPDVWLSDSYSNNSWANSDGKQRIDDLWHAAINGHGSFVVATDTDKFATALTNALATIDSRSASGSNIASSSTKTDTSTLTFVAGFTSSTWLGDLIASPFNASLTGVSNASLWTLSKTFATGGANESFASRTVLTSKGGTAANFDSSVSDAGDFAARTGQADAVVAVDNIAYLRGDQSKELGHTNGTLRKRTYPLGDIVDSSPAYVTDSNSVYIGANDGMLHGIDASNGKVLFSYVPKGIDFAAMASLSGTAYEHRYFVDGQIDVISKALQGNGKNILVGALGRGGRGVFALDVTDPTAMDTSDVLWDNTTQDITTELDMGYVLGGVRIRNGNGGKTYAFVPNGMDSPNGSATLFVYELNANGGIAATTKLVADNTGGNGLMSLGMADLNGDGKLDVVYGGDLKGNVWRWDFGAAALPSAAVKLFQATDATGKAQPITGGLGVGRTTSGTIFVGFGTGRFISSNDVPGVATQTTQSIYGIIDSNTLITGRDKLEARTIPYSGTGVSGEKLRGFENYSVLPTGKLGWYIDLTVPERVISAPTVYGSAMYLSSVIPATGSDCEGVTGSGYLNVLNLFTGTSPASGGYFNDAGAVTDTGGNSGTVGSIGISGGMPTEVNVTNTLATVGTGAFSSDGTGNTSSTKIPPPGGGAPSRVNWREVVPK